MNVAVLTRSSWVDNQREVSASTSNTISLVWSLPSFSQDNDNVIMNTDVLDKEASGVLGKNGLQRFEEFKLYKNGWDHGKGKALSLRSVAILERFINNYKKFSCEPSLFFTRDGNLQLGWEDSSGKSIELEFFPNKIEFYIESKYAEGAVSVSEPGINELISYLNNC